MKKSLTGYKKNSKDKNEPILEIPGGNITMRNVPHEVLALLDDGSTHLMKPGKDYKFNTSKTIEIPMKKKQKGGLLKDFETYLSSLDEASQDSLLDYFDELDTEDQKRFLHGGRVTWEYQLGGNIMDTASLLNPPKQAGVLSLPKISREEIPGNFSDYVDKLAERKLRIKRGLAAQTLEARLRESNAVLDPNRSTFGGTNKVTSRDRFRERKQGGLIYQNGGGVPVEVEHDETILNPDGELYGFNGNTHAEGGIDILAQPGAKIFSEYSKAPKELVKTVLGRDVNKKMSYADLSKKFDTTKYAKILDNPDMDEFAKNTAKLKMEGHRAVLETIFQTQEAEKVKENKGNKAQHGGPVLPQKKMYTSFWDTYVDKSMGADNEPLEISQSLTPLQQIRAMYNTLPEATVVGKRPEYPGGSAYNLAVTETSPSELASPPGRITSEIFIGGALPPASTVLPVVDPGKSSLHQVLNTPVPKNRTGYSQLIPTSSTSTDGSSTGIPRSATAPLAPLPKMSIPNPSSIGYGHHNNPQRVQLPQPSQTQTQDSSKKGKSKFGISDKLAGTVLDIGLALSDDLNVREPNYHDLRKTPLFSRFVDFDDKEAGRNLALNIQQIQNSNMPEEVKQARIADLNAQYKDHTAKVAFTNAQRYEQKLNQDTEKLQNYINNNIDQHFQDVERYSQQKAHVDMLRDQFEAQRKSRVVNAVRGYLEYVNKTHLQNQILSENYRVNPITGRVDFKGGTPDALKKKEMEMQQYQQNAVPVKNLPNGAVLAKTPSGVEIIIDQTGKATIVK